MPRISEKAQLTIQLQDLWLANAIGDVLLSGDALESLVQSMIGSAGSGLFVSRERRVDWNAVGLATGEATLTTGLHTGLDLAWLAEGFEEVRNTKAEDDSIYGMRGSQLSLD